ncbi:coniferyl-alcohol dehydrogenase [Pseudomaricurvus sp. HS19]|uniref:coniferyl-alcohol dehydrogenase n=1 Tax=Pseudomaricurvus sp. HS19 TaxID=2692626 RepID=UPI0019256CE3|nr:coniferyl-alcohol dehydrogenase [Pseudomaricurvus sp. HS19]
MDILGYKGKRVIVSGCFSGMGEATARKLVELGAEVHGFDFKETSLELASFNLVDLRDPATIDAAVANVGGKIDALFNCAGLPQTAPAMDVMRVNFIGTRHLTEKVLELMGEGGAIASISSTGGLGWSRRVPVLMELISQQGYQGALDWCEGKMDEVRDGYSTSKEAVIVWTMLSCASLIKKGIRINCTLPSPTQTPMMKHFREAAGDAVDVAMQPIGRYSTPEEQANALIFLNSDIATIVNGVVLPADGGFMGAVTTGQIDLAAMMGKK